MPSRNYRITGKRKNVKIEYSFPFDYHKNLLLLIVIVISQFSKRKMLKICEKFSLYFPFPFSFCKYNNIIIGLMQQVGVWKERVSDGVVNDGWWNIPVHWGWADERIEKGAFHTDEKLVGVRFSLRSINGKSFRSSSVFLLRWNGIVKNGKCNLMHKRRLLINRKCYKENYRWKSVFNFFILTHISRLIPRKMGWNGNTIYFSFIFL